MKQRFSFFQFSNISFQSSVIISFLLMLCVMFCAVDMFSLAKNKGNKKRSSAQSSKKKKSSSGKKSSKRSSRGKSSKKGRGRRGRTERRVIDFQPKPRTPKAISQVVITEDSLITDGVIYRKLDVTHTDSSKTSVHTLTCVLRNPQFSVSVMKSQNRADGLERLSDLITRTDSAEGKKVFAAINANFWRAVSNIPLGPTVVNGEVVEMLRYRGWNSCFFDSKGKPYIDSFRVKANIRTKGGIYQNITSVNRRLMADSMVLYNSFVGNAVPYIPERKIDKLVAEMMSDSVAMMYDSTQVEFNRDSLKQLVMMEKQQQSNEYGMKKILIRYLRQPILNQEIPVIVLSTHDSGAVNVPIRGAILSMSREVARPLYLQAGDTLYLKYTTTILDTINFTQAICGTPRLVIDGKVNPALMSAENPSQRFVNSRLARTAIGNDFANYTLYLCVVEANQQSKGFTIPELAEFMKRFGAYNALNLDGGGSSQMMLGRNVVSHPSGFTPRRISLALSLGKKKMPPKLGGK
jgi:hypothetical protein